MFPVSNRVSGFTRLSYPNVCPGQPVGKKAFCAEHCVLAERLNYPTDIKKFLKFEKSNKSPEDCGMQATT